MQSITEGLFTAIVLFFAVAIGTSFILPIMNSSNLEAKEHQLEEVASKVFYTIVLNPGVPSNWGEDININAENLKAFGLAKENPSFMYELDINKVLRICNSTNFVLPQTLYIDPETVAKLLGLREKEFYGFSISITPALNITYEIKGYYARGNVQAPSKFLFFVKNYAGLPAANSNLTITYILVPFLSKGNDNDISFYNVTRINTSTDWNGTAYVDITDWLSSVLNSLGNKGTLNKLTITTVITGWYFGIRSMCIINPSEQDLLYGSISGDILILLYPVGQIPSGAEQIKDVVLDFVSPYYVYLNPIKNETNGESGLIINRGAKKYMVYKLEKPIEDEVAAILIPVKYTGKYYTVTITRIPYIINFSTGKPGAGIKTVVIGNVVRIGAFDYYFKLTMWRIVEK